MQKTASYIAIAFICLILLSYEYFWIPMENFEVTLRENSLKYNSSNSLVKNELSDQTFVLPSWSKDDKIVFLHIGKTGGTSLDTALVSLVGFLGMFIDIFDLKILFIMINSEFLDFFTLHLIKTVAA